MAAQRPVSKWVKLMTTMVLGLAMVCGLLIFYGGLVSPAAASPLNTAVSGSIVVDTVWTPAGSPYTVTGSVNVQAKLTIQPGVEVQFGQDGQLQIGNGGELFAVGTPTAPITFTSQFTQARGFWDGIRFVATSLTGTIQYAVIEYSKVGVELLEGQFHDVSSNTFRYIGDDQDPSNSGVIVGSPDSNSLNYNTAYSSVTGIRLVKPGLNEIIGNHIYDIDGDCIAFVSPGAPSANNKIFDNRIHHCGGRGIRLEETSSIGAQNQIVGNVISHTQNGAIYLRRQSLATITHNLVFDIPASSGSGLILDSFHLGIDPVHSNLICVDDRYEIDNRVGTSLTAEGNWLGTNAPAAGTEINGPVDFTPSITLTATPAPSAIPANGVATTTITIRMNDGQGHTVPALARTVDVTTTMGTLSAPAVTLNGAGVATVTLTAPTTLGTAVITVTEFCNYPVTTTVEFQAADLSLSKTSSITQVAPGGLITYTIHYTNNGNVAAENVVITDILPAGTVWHSDDAVSQGFTRTPVLPTTAITWEVGSVPGSGGNGSITLVARVEDQTVVGCIPGGEPLTNRVAIESSTFDINDSDNSVSDLNGVSIVCADVAINKIGPGGSVRPGQRVTYTLVYSNIGDILAEEVIITDSLPSGTGYYTDSSGFPVNGTDPITWSIGPLDINDQGNFQLVLSTTTGMCGDNYLTNQASIGTATPEITTINNIASVNDPQIECLPDLVVTKEDNRSPLDPPVWAGDLITYTISYSNVGWGDAPAVILTETLPAYTEFEGPAGPNGWFQVGSSHVYTYRVGVVPYTGPGSSGTVNFVVRVAPALPVTATVVTNTVEIGSGLPDDNPADNEDEIDTPVQSTPDLVVTKAALTPTAWPGSLVSYAITLTNQSDTTATNVVITDSLPLSTTYHSDTLGGHSGSGSGPITWNIGQLLPNATRRFTLTVQAGGDICAPGYPDTHLLNTVEAFGSEPDRNPADNIFTTRSDASSPSIVCHDVAITKTLSSTPPSLGKPAIFTITYQNIGTYTASNVVITDFLASNVVYITDTFTAGTRDTTGNPVWSLSEDLGPGQSGVFTVGLQLTVCPPGQNTVSFTNTVRIGSDPADDQSNNESSANSGNIPCDQVDLVVIKNDGVGSGDPITQVVASGYITYQISVNNIGDEPANNVVLTETLPAHTDFVRPLGPLGWFQVGSSDQYIYNLGTLASGSGRVITFVVRVVPGLSCTVTEVVNTVQAGSDGPEADPGDNIVYEQTPVICNPTANLRVQKDDGVICAAPGQTITYTITYSNVGGTPGTPVNNGFLTDLKPEHTSFLPGGVNANWVEAGAGVYTQALGTVAAGGPFGPVYFQVQLANRTQLAGVNAITNVIQISGGNSFTEVTLIPPVPDLVIAKNDNIGVTVLSSEFAALYQQVTGTPPPAPIKAQASHVGPEDIIEYTIVYVNNGLDTASGVVLTDTLPLYTSYAGGPEWSHASGRLYTHSVGDLAPGQGGMITFRVQVDSSLPSDLEWIINRVEIGGFESDDECNRGNNVSYEQTPVLLSNTDTNLYLPIIFKNPESPLPLPSPTPTPTPLAYVSDVAVDPDTNQVFVASPRHDWVYVIDGSSDTIDRNVPVGHGPTGLTVLEATSPANNKVFVAHQYGANNWQPGVKVFGVNESASYDTSDGGYAGAAPIKITANAANNNRVYVSNYFDKLAVLNSESRLGWVEQKAYQAAYGIEASSATNRVYLATRDTGELIVFDGQGDRLLQTNYIPTHVKPPQACSLWSVAVNEVTGHVFVPCPELSKVYVLQEGQVTILGLEALGVLEKRYGYWALVVSPAAAPWIQEIDIPNGTGLGEEGITVLDSETGHIFITNAHDDSVVILKDDPVAANIGYITTVPVGDQPQGIAVNPDTEKVYVGNTGSNSVTVLNAASPFAFNIITTISLTP